MTQLQRPWPDHTTLQGRYCRLEPLALTHAADLFEASAGQGNRPRFDYLFEYPPESRADMEAWLTSASQSADPLYFAVIDLSSGRCQGRQALMRITPGQGCIELGGIYWGPAISRTRVATEACFLHLQYAFDTLGYRRFEWKCNNLNEASKRAALRFGFSFEGVFRQHMMIKGKNRDTAWFSIIDSEWPLVKAGFERWLDPQNFDSQAQQRERLQISRELA